MNIKGKWQRTLYQKDNFSIALFKATKPFTFPKSDKEQLYFKAKGFDLPLKRNVISDFSGEWQEPSATSSKKEYLFNVVECNDIMPTDAAGIMRYLQTLDGIGKKSATKLYAAYGNDVFDVFDNNINQVLEDKIIRKASFTKLKACWLKKNKKEGELFIYLGKFGVSENVIMRIYDKHQEFSLDLIKQDPYSFTDIYGFGFHTADSIAKDNAMDGSDLWRHETPRIKAAIIEVLKTFENGGTYLNTFNKAFGTNYQAGNTCIEWPELYKLTKYLLGTEITDIKLYKILTSMNEDRIMIDSNNYVFRYETWQRESGVAKNVTRLVKETAHLSRNLSTEDTQSLLNMAIDKNVLSFKLSDEQMNAVTTVMNNGFSIVTGGPGTGKTAIQKMIIYSEKHFNPSSEIILAAPTGRAARRMSESTGYPAQTIHSLLGLVGNENYTGNISKVDCDLLIIDESSMVDIALANYLFAAVSNKTRLVFVGDDKQLPSVGPGSVLRELINSNCVPVAALTTVFRQGKGSYIGFNAKRIIYGTERMLEDESFKFIEAADTTDIVNTIKNIYPEYLMKYGVSNLCVLSPLRRFNSRKKHTYSAVENLNSELQKIIFEYESPPKGTFLVNDKVMYTKNDNGLANGDVGVVTAINRYDGELVITCNFDGVSVELEGEMINNLELAYATTVHKSQGSEYKCVLFVVDSKHSIMLKRNIVYTAVTRAKQEIVIIGQRSAYTKAISCEETDSRLSCLSSFIQRRFKETLPKSEDSVEKQISIFEIA